jgi:hypothetical protein
MQYQLSAASHVARQLPRMSASTSKHVPASNSTSGTSGEDSDEETACCWICHSGAEAGALEQPRRCPRHVHLACLSRWQLASAGKAEERTCRFCFEAFPCWREVHRSLPQAIPM